MRILVTGSNGQVGRALRKSAENSSFEFLFTDRKSLDISDEVQVRDVVLGFKPKVIVNAAAYTAVDKAEEDEELCRKINATALKYLTKEHESIEDSGLFIHISTDYVYHPDHDSIISERDTTNPQSVYATTKLEGEKTVAESTVDFMILRTSWVYDEDGHNFVNTMTRLGEIKDSLNVVSDQVGSPTYAGDIAEVILTAINRHAENNTLFAKNKIFNFSNEGFTNWAEFAKEIMKLNEHSCVIHPIPTSEYPTPARRPLNSRLDKSLIKETLEIEIPHWKNSLAKCLENKQLR